jgi:hypothetical protein
VLEISINSEISDISVSYPARPHLPADGDLDELDAAPTPEADAVDGDDPGGDGRQVAVMGDEQHRAVRRGGPDRFDDAPGRPGIERGRRLSSVNALGAGAMATRRRCPPDSRPRFPSGVS